MGTFLRSEVLSLDTIRRKTLNLHVIQDYFLLEAKTIIFIHTHFSSIKDVFILDMNKSVIIEDTISQLNSILSSAQEQFNVDPNSFLSQNGISSLGKYIPIVSNLFHVLNLSDYNELKEYLENPSFSDLRIRWDQFLSELDKQSVLSTSYPTSLPSDVQLLNADNNELTNLESIYTNHDRNLFIFLRHLA